MVDIKRVGKVFVQGDEKFTTEFAKKLETGAIQEDIKNAAEAGKNANLAPLAKDGIELGGHESPSPNVKMTRQPIPKAILDFLEKGDIKAPTGTGKTQIEKILGNEPIEGLVTQDISTMITPAADKVKLLKDVAEAEAKYMPNITTVIGDEALPNPPKEIIIPPAEIDGASKYGLQGLHDKPIPKDAPPQEDGLTKYGL